MDAVFNEVVSRIEAGRDSSGAPLRMMSLMCSEEDQTRRHDFTHPQHVNVRSIAKPITCLVVGCLIEQGVELGGSPIRLESPVLPLLERFANFQSEEVAERWSNVTVIDLLRITFGQDQGLVFSKDIAGRDPSSLVDYVVNFPLTREVGVDFRYSNAGTFLLSAILTEWLGRKLEEFVQELLFSPMDIVDVRWDSFGNYTAACTGLWMLVEDLHKIGRLVADDGLLGSRSLVPSSFVRLMKTPLIAPPTHRYIADRAFPKWSYGLNLWICEDGDYYCDGSDGQYLLVIPRRGRVITALGFQPDTAQVSAALGLFK